MPSFSRSCRIAIAALLAAAAAVLHGQGSTSPSTPAGTVTLSRPLGLAYDMQGDLFFADSGHHSVRCLDPAGNLTTVAGTGSQGFSGDGGPATMAQLDTPGAVALDAAGDLYVSDTHNNRIRRLDAVTHIITTVAGSGVFGFAGDGGPAVSARLASPLALQLGAGNLLVIADTRNHRIRSLDLQTGILTTVAGTGMQGFSGDGDLAVNARLDAPSGLALDPAGNVYVADTGNHRIRRIDAVTHLISTVPAASPSMPILRPVGLAVVPSGLLIADAASQRVLHLDLAAGSLKAFAGQGTQSFQGDNGPATAASLDTPTALAVNPSGGVSIADSGNARIRMVGEDGSIATIAGLGTLATGTLSLSGASTQSYGSATLLATLSSGTTSPATLSLLDTTTGSTALLGQSAVASGVARFDLSTLSVGTHLLSATFSGDATHRPAQSPTLALTVAPRPLSAALTGSTSAVFGQSIPPLSAILSGVLPADQSQLAAIVSTSASANSPPGSYPLSITLAGAAAGNYTLAANAAALTIAKAPVAASLSQAGNTLTIQVTGAPLHSPTGTVTLLTSAGTRFSTVLLSASGTAQIATSSLANGTYTLAAIYSGDADYLSAQSPALTLSVGPTPVAPDFSFNMATAATQTVSSGETAKFGVALKLVGTTSLAGPITLSASALPAGFVTTFDPAVIPPGGGVTSFTMSIVTPRALAANKRIPTGQRWIASACLAPLIFLAVSRRRRKALIGSLLALALCGCGARINSAAFSQSPSATYPITITGTSTNLDGSVLQRTATVTLTVQ